MKNEMNDSGIISIRKLNGCSTV